MGATKCHCKRDEAGRVISQCDACLAWRKVGAAVFGKSTGDLTANFSRSEFACPCGCGADDINMALVETLQEVRDAYGKPIAITCGVRCRGLNATVSKYPIHPDGNGADIEMPKDGEDRHNLLLLLLAGFDRVGIYDRHIHVDTDKRYKQPWLWLGKSR